MTTIPMCVRSLQAAGCPSPNSAGAATTPEPPVMRTPSDQHPGIEEATRASTRRRARRHEPMPTQPCQPSGEEAHNNVDRDASPVHHHRSGRHALGTKLRSGAVRRSKRLPIAKRQAAAAQSNPLVEITEAVVETTRPLGSV